MYIGNKKFKYSDFLEYIEMITNGEREEAEAFRKSFVPQALSKFISLSEDEEENEKKYYSLENNMLWFSSTDKINDPYEFKGFYVDEELSYKSGLTKEQIFRLNEYIKIKCGIVSFSARDVGFLPMWAYYTNNNKGFCVEYEVFDASNIYPVLYIPFRINIAYMIRVLEEESTSSHRYNVAKNYISEYIYIKGDDWKHEKEYRIVMDISNETGENKCINMLGIKVKRIVAGINCSRKSVLRLNEISNKIGCGNVYVARLSKRKYSIEIERYNAVTE